MLRLPFGTLVGRPYAQMTGPSTAPGPVAGLQERRGVEGLVEVEPDAAHHVAEHVVEPIVSSSSTTFAGPRSDAARSTSSSTGWPSRTASSTICSTRFRGGRRPHRRSARSSASICASETPTAFPIGTCSIPLVVGAGQPGGLEDCQFAQVRLELRAGEDRLASRSVSTISEGAFASIEKRFRRTCRRSSTALRGRRPSFVRTRQQGHGRRSSRRGRV